MRCKMRKKSFGNPPYSPYHHKTEAPGMPGHHRLSEIKNTCLPPAVHNKVVGMINDLRSDAYDAGINGDEQAYRELRLTQAEINRLIGTCRCPASKKPKK